jgi:hypothetical protein
MPENKDFILLKKKFSRKKFLLLFGTGSVTLFAFAKNPYGWFKKRLTERKQGSAIIFKKNPLSVKRNNI